MCVDMLGIFWYSIYLLFYGRAKLKKKKFSARKIMPRKKKAMGAGAVVKVLLRYIHPSAEIRAKYANPEKGDRLCGCKVLKKDQKVVNRREQAVIVFYHKEFPLVELYAVTRYVSVEEEGPPEDFFGDDETAVEDEVVQRPNVNVEESNHEEDDTPMSAILEQIAGLHVGGEIEANEFANAGLVVDNDNDPLPENLLPQDNTVNTNACVYEEWGHSGICHRRKDVSNVINPQLKVSDSSKNFSRVELFELLFITDYIKKVILININENITGDRVTYGEFLRWLGIWFLICTVIGPSRESFFLNQPCDEFSEAPFRVSHYMSRRRFDKILNAIRYPKSGPPPYKDRFWEVRDMIKAWNDNMASSFGPGWVSCLDESMSPWTNKYTCPGHMCVPRKPWPLGNEYHSICCCISGLMYAIELVEGKDRPKQKPAEKFSDVAQNGTTTSLLLRLCESIFHIGMVVILDSGFCVLRAIIELKKRGVFASALIKKRRYWPKDVGGDQINSHFEDKDVGDVDSLPGRLDNIPFHIFGMKEPDYVMKLMSTYGTNERVESHTTRREWINSDKKKVSKSFCYPEVVSNHFKYRHSVDDHNAKRHAPICLEHVWATKYWPHRPFSFLLAITEVNVNLAEAYFVRHKAPRPQLEFRKLIAKDLIHNEYLMEEQNQQELRRSQRKRHLSTHCLQSLPPFRKFVGTKIQKSKSKYPQATCTSGHRKVRTYCICTPGILRCDQCFALHCIEVNTTAAMSD